MDRSDLERTHLIRAARQQVATVGLLGVDFVPVRARKRIGVAPEAVAQAEPARASVVVTREAAKVVVGPSVSTTLPPAAAPVLFEEEATSPPSDGVSYSGDGAVDVVDAEPLPRLSAVEAARRLELLRARYEADAPHAKFVTDHHSIVFGEGDPLARLMFIGEAPGAEEDRTGRPFVGKAGVLLDKMITALGLRREEVYIANVLKTRPPNNATPTPEEAAACAPYLFEQVAIIRPEVIVTLGLPATRCVLATTESMARMRGRWAGFRLPVRGGAGTPGMLRPPLIAVDPLPRAEGVIPVMPTYHPAFLLRSYTAENRQKVWSDLRMAGERLGLAIPAKASGVRAGADES